MSSFAPAAQLDSEVVSSIRRQYSSVLAEGSRRGATHTCTPELKRQHTVSFRKSIEPTCAGVADSRPRYCQHRWSTVPGRARWNAGQPVPASNASLALNKEAPQHAQRKPDVLPHSTADNAAQADGWTCVMHTPEDQAVIEGEGPGSVPLGGGCVQRGQCLRLARRATRKQYSTILTDYKIIAGQTTHQCAAVAWVTATDLSHRSQQQYGTDSSITHQSCVAALARQWEDFDGCPQQSRRYPAAIFTPACAHNAYMYVQLRMLYRTSTCATCLFPNRGDGRRFVVSLISVCAQSDSNLFRVDWPAISSGNSRPETPQAPRFGGHCSTCSVHVHVHCTCAGARVDMQSEVDSAQVGVCTEFSERRSENSFRSHDRVTLTRSNPHVRSKFYRAARV